MGARVTKVDNRGQGPLNWAMADNQLTHLLVRSGADPNLRDLSGFAPIHYVQRLTVGDRSAWLNLRECGALGTYRTRDGRTAEQLARQAGHVGFANWLKTAQN